MRARECLLLITETTCDAAAIDPRGSCVTGLRRAFSLTSPLERMNAFTVFLAPRGPVTGRAIRANRGNGHHGSHFAKCAGRWR